MNKPERNPSDPISIILTEKEWNLILNDVKLPSELSQIIRMGTLQDEEVEICFSDDEFEEFMDIVLEQEEKCTNAKKAEMWDAICDKILSIVSELSEDENISIQEIAKPVLEQLPPEIAERAKKFIAENPSATIKELNAVLQSYIDEYSASDPEKD